MYTCQILTDSNACVRVDRFYTLVGLFTVEPPPHVQWWGWDANFGSNKYMLSMRQSIGERPEYMIWKCFNNTSLSTSQIILSTNDIPSDIPIKYVFMWTVGFMSDLITAKWARWRFSVPWSDASKVKDV